MKQITSVIISDIFPVNFAGLNKPLLHASAGDKSLHPAPTGSVMNHTSTDRSLDWTVCLCSVTLLPLMHFQVYMNKKRVTDARCAKDICVIFETSL